jgi:hypothetical protein
MPWQVAKGTAELGINNRNYAKGTLTGSKKHSRNIKD